MLQELWLRADTWGGVLGLATNLILIRFLTARLAHVGWFAHFYFIHLLTTQLALLVSQARACTCRIKVCSCTIAC